MTDVLKSNVQE